MVSPGVEVFFNANLAAASHTIVISRIRNPSALREVEVRVRILEGTSTSAAIELYSTIQRFLMTNDVVLTAADIITFTGTVVAQSLAQLDFNPITPITTGATVILFAPSTIGGKTSYPTPTVFLESYPSAGVYITNSLTISSTNFELPIAATNL
jgi:hypothetical protein